MIKKPNELKFEDKKFSMIIAGVPGIGKTTLALSAPKPLLIDLDKGISRVEALYRRDTDEVSNFDELVNDLKTADLSGYETIVIDTGGKLLEMLKPVAIKTDPKNGKRDGALSLQGYGWIKRRFSEFSSNVKALGKNVIYVFHASEVAIGDDNTGLRIRVEGKTRDEVWDDIDIGGFMEMKGNRRTIGFSNCDRYYAKGTHSVHGVYEIPELKDGAKNTFISDLFVTMRNDLTREQEEANSYQRIMDECTPLVKDAKNADDINKACAKIAKQKHILTSKDELGFMVKEKCKELKLTYDRKAKLFVNNSKSSE